MVDRETIKAIQKMNREGASVSSIAKQVGLSRFTVRKYLMDGGDPPIEASQWHDKNLVKKESQQLSRANSLVQSMRDELETSKVEFEIEKIEDVRSRWGERRDRERKEKVEVEQAQRLKEFIVRESSRKQEEREGKARAVIQRVKETVIPTAEKKIFPPSILALLYQELERVLSKMDVCALPFDELIVLARGIKERVVEQNIEEIGRGVSNYLRGLAEIQLNQVIEMQRENFQKLYRESGGKLSYREFILNEVNRYVPEKSKREKILNMIGV